MTLSLSNTWIRLRCVSIRSVIQYQHVLNREFNYEYTCISKKESTNRINFRVHKARNCLILELIFILKIVSNVLFTNFRAYKTRNCLSSSSQNDFPATFLAVSLSSGFSKDLYFSIAETKSSLFSTRPPYLKHNWGLTSNLETKMILPLFAGKGASLLDRAWRMAIRTLVDFVGSLET